MDSSILQIINTVILKTRNKRFLFWLPYKLHDFVFKKTRNSLKKKCSCCNISQPRKNILRHVTASDFVTRFLCFKIQTLSSVSLILSVSTEMCKVLAPYWFRFTSYAICYELFVSRLMLLRSTSDGPVCFDCINDNSIMHHALVSRVTSRVICMMLFYFWCMAREWFIQNKFKINIYSHLYAINYLILLS